MLVFKKRNIKIIRHSSEQLKLKKKGTVPTVSTDIKHCLWENDTATLGRGFVVCFKVKHILVLVKMAA